MGIDNPIGDRPKDPFAAYKIRIDSVGKGKEEGDDEKEPPGKRSYVIIKLIQLIKSAIDFILNRDQKESYKDAHALALENLAQFKSFFEILKKEDRSQDIVFLNQLSKIWYRAFEDSVRFKRQPRVSLPFRKFLKDLQDYPPEDDRSFGYYLTECTDQQWLPFPYMKLVEQIHREYNEAPKASALARWIFEIDSVVEALIEVS